MGCRMAQAWADGALDDRFAEVQVERDDTDVSTQTLKERGNAHFKAKRYTDARDCYADAIDSELACDFAGGSALAAALYLNRCACHLQLRDFDAALLDASRAVQLS